MGPEAGLDGFENLTPTGVRVPKPPVHSEWLYRQYNHSPMYEGWNFNSGNYLFTTDTK